MDVGKTELAEIFGVSIKTIDNWIKKDMPYVEKPDGEKINQWVFNTIDVIAWREKRLKIINPEIEYDINSARARKMTAESALLEIKLAEKRKDLIPVEEVERGMHEMCTNLRNRLLAIPAKIAPQLTKENFKLLESEIYEALEELSG